jgi:hypothetical protein
MKDTINNIKNINKNYEKICHIIKRNKTNQVMSLDKKQPTSQHPLKSPTKMKTRGVHREL